MYKVIIFAGTTEGILLCDLLARNEIYTYACVATEYGSLSYEKSAYLSVHAKRLTQEEMEALFREIRPEMVLDATHPYASEVTKNIRAACENTGFLYQRVLRDEGAYSEKGVYVESTEAAIEFLKGTEGNILLTTGSKELGKYTELPNYADRLYARVLSLPSVMEACSTYGLVGKHLIGMQGPFSKELNTAMLRQYDCKYMVTKDTGKAGGFQEKIDAAYECGAIPVIIGRPLKEEGMTVAQCSQMLAETYKFKLEPDDFSTEKSHFLSITDQYISEKSNSTSTPHVTLLGIGMGSEDTLTMQGKKAIEKADLLIGARRMVDSVRLPYQDVVYEYKSESICQYIETHKEYKNIVIVLSGDVGFYSGAKKLLDLLRKPEIHKRTAESGNVECEALESSSSFNGNVEIICGISSVVYFMSKIGLSWDDAVLASVHGRNCNLISQISHNPKVFSILGTRDGVAVLAKKLQKYGMGEVLLYVGENLSYENELIFMKKASELTEYEGDALCVVCALNVHAQMRKETHGIADEEFIRGKAPMTKEEVRAVSLSKLQLTKDSVCYDVGAGTGSVSIEMALRAYEGKVYAIEMKEDALALLEENKQKFAVDNLEIIAGMAPRSMINLPAPTHAFIGGSSGNLKEIMKVLTDKNPDVRMVINCITLETISEALDVIKEFGFKDHQIVQMSVSRSKVLGRYHMMMGENPIYVIVCQYPWEENNS